MQPDVPQLHGSWAGDYPGRSQLRAGTQSFLQTLFLALNFQQSFRFLSVSFALCVVALWSWLRKLVKGEAGLARGGCFLKELSSRSTILYKALILTRLFVMFAPQSISWSVHRHREGGNHAWNYFLVRPLNSVFNFLFYKGFLRWWMMLTSIFETKILLCVYFTFGNLKLFSPLTLYSPLITTEMISPFQIGENYY